VRALKRDGMRKSDERGQLILVAGFAVGLGIVVLTIMLNNVIYASNIASESSTDTSRYEMANAIKMTSETYEDAYRYATENGSFNSILFDQYLESYAKLASKNYAISGLTFDFENNTLHEAFFTQNGLADGRDDWTVVSNINTTDVFVLEIPDTSKLGNSSDSMKIIVTNSSGLLWSIELYNSSGSINVTVSDQSSTIGTYTASRQVNITGNKIDFTTNPIPAVQFPDHTAGGDYSINILNGSNAVGYCAFSGYLTSGEQFTFARYWIVNPAITMRSSEMNINRNLPVSLPGGSI
jgi:hypothetical protein